MSTTPLTPEIVSQDGNAMVLSMGPQHPSTHGVLQIMLEIEGETRRQSGARNRLSAHRHREELRKSLLVAGADQRRAHGLSRARIATALCYALGVEKLLGITDRHSGARARKFACLIAELTRIASHCVWLGTHGIDLGAISVFFYCFDLRENILDLQEAAGGARMHPNYVRVGGVNGDLPDGYPGEARRVDRKIPGPHARTARAAAGQSDLPRPHDRRRLSSRRKKRCSGTSPGRRCARSGIAYDVRKAFPYSGYEQYDFDVPTRTEGDAYARFLVRLDEMDESHAHHRPGARGARTTPGPVLIDDPKIFAPPKETIALSMEALIHHFKIVSEGFRVPPGDVYQAVEGPRGELGLLHRQQRRQPSVPRAHASADRCTTCKRSKAWRRAI